MTFELLPKAEDNEQESLAEGLARVKAPWRNSMASYKERGARGAAGKLGRRGLWGPSCDLTLGRFKWRNWPTAAVCRVSLCPWLT